MPLHAPRRPRRVAEDEGGEEREKSMTCPEGTLSLLDFAEDTLRRRLAVSPPHARALVASVLPNGRRGEQGERRAAS